MKPQTLATLNQLNDVDWFSKVGVVDTENAVVLKTWAEAVDSCRSVNWENLCLEAANQFRLRVAEADQSRFEAWNTVSAEVRAAVIPLVDKKIAAFISAHQLPKVFEDTVRWDILHLCMESEYADICAPGFFAAQAYWYANGHFPCGWEGNFPSGRLIVY